MHSLAFRVAGGLKAAGEKVAGKELSHWIPERYLKSAGTYIEDKLGTSGAKKILVSKFGRSPLNSNYVTPYRHFLHDPKRFISGWQSMRRLSPVLQQLDRVPRVYYGGSAGAAYGSASISSNHGGN